MIVTRLRAPPLYVNLLQICRVESNLIKVMRAPAKSFQSVLPTTRAKIFQQASVNSALCQACSVVP
jgi:hypothetical protein